MHMKSTYAAGAGSKDITGSTRRHINTRINKASKYAGHLVDLLKSRKGSTTETNILEARAYFVSLLGAADFEKQSWKKCLQSYSEARFIYSALVKNGNANTGDLLRDPLSSTIDPSIRYAAYQSKIPRTTSIDSIVLQFVSRGNNEYVAHVLETNPNALDNPTTGSLKGPSGDAENLPKTISWRSRIVNLEDAATAQALAAVAAAEENLSTFLSDHIDSEPRAKAAAYDEVLIPSQDAVDATKTAIDELSTEGIPQSDRRMQALQITRTAVNYALIGWRIGRNRILCGQQDGAVLEDLVPKKPKKPRKDGKEWIGKEGNTGRKLARLRERVVLYDATLQSVEAVKELPGVAADQDFTAELEGKRAYFAALR